MVNKFWNNLNGGLQVAERKFKNSIPDHLMRKTYNTFSKVNQAAIPMLGIASAVQPELSPLFGSISAGLVGAEALSKDLQQYDNSIDHYKHKAHFV